MTITDLRNDGLILLECISGSRAYGLDTPQSDTDIRGVFLLPKARFYGLDYVPQVANATNDIVFYELGRYMQLLAQNNPNILELLNTPPDAVLYRHPALDAIRPEDILSKLCRDTFGKFALSQIKKAKGLNKKMVNPVEQERKDVLAFCYVNHDNGSLPVADFLALRGWQQSDCGLTNIPHMKDVYGLYHQPGAGFGGIVRHVDSNDVCLSPIPKGLAQAGLLYFNRDGYSAYCKAYREYWDWVDKRNEDRYQNTQHHGKNYDAKNMMHVFRLLDMALEIGTEHRVNVQRPNREFLLAVKAGEFEYADLLELAEQKQQELDRVFATSSLPDTPDMAFINDLTYRLRDALYG